MNIGQSTKPEQSAHHRDRRGQEEKESQVVTSVLTVRQWMDAYDIHQLSDNEAFLE
jgi:hypothetical protein